MKALRLWLIMCVAIELAGAAERADPRDESYRGIPITKDTRQKFVLVSWRGNDGAYRFAILPNTRQKVHSFLDQFQRSQPGIVRLEELRQALGNLPKRSLVTWIKDAPRAVTYPEQSVIRKVKEFATRMHLDLQFNETRYEQPGV